MKTSFLIVALLATFIASSQGFRFKEGEDFKAGIVFDPTASIKERGLCIGAEVKYNGPGYIKLSVLNFSALEDGYTDLYLSGGPNFTIGYFQKVEFYVGGKIGFIHRGGGNPEASFGIESGLDWNVSKSMYIGGRISYDYRPDWEFYGADPGWRESGWLVAGVRF